MSQLGDGMVPLNPVYAMQASTYTRELYEEKCEFTKRIRTGVSVNNLWILIPRMRYEIRHQKQNEAFIRLCWVIRSFYKSPLTFRINS